MRHLILLAALIGIPGSLAAQTPDPRTRAAETVTALDLARYIGVIAHDSMMGRDTPSRGLEMTARYLADQFNQLALYRGGDKGTWFQRYPVPPRIDFSKSQVTFTTGENKAAASFTNAARLAQPFVPPQQVTTTNLVLVAGRHTGKTLEQANLYDKIVLYVTPAGAKMGDVAGQQDILNGLRATQGLIVLSNEDSAQFTERLHFTQRRSTVLYESRNWDIRVRPEAVTGLTDVLRAAGVDLARVRTDTTPIVRDLPSLQVSLDLQIDRSANDTATAPNVVAVLPGSDPQLRKEFIVISAHMDQTSTKPGQIDSVNNGADDNASGTAGLIALAKAFSQPGMRPKRTLLFLATSGGTKELWGSATFVNRILDMSNLFGIAVYTFRASRGNDSTNGASIYAGDTLSAVEMSNTVLNVNLDMIGRNMSDSITIKGLADVELPASPLWTAAAHSELHLTVVDGGSSTRRESDHFAFTKIGVPSLYFHQGSHDRRPSTDVLQTIDTDHLARVLRLVFYIGQDIFSGPSMRWTSEGRRHLLENVPPQ